MKSTTHRHHASLGTGGIARRICAAAVALGLTFACTATVALACEGEVVGLREIAVSVQLSAANSKLVVGRADIGVAAGQVTAGDATADFASTDTSAVGGIEVQVGEQQNYGAVCEDGNVGSEGTLETCAVNTQDREVIGTGKLAKEKCLVRLENSFDSDPCVDPGRGPKLRFAEIRMTLEHF